VKSLDNAGRKPVMAVGIRLLEEIEEVVAGY